MMVLFVTTPRGAGWLSMWTKMVQGTDSVAWTELSHTHPFTATTVALPSVCTLEEEGRQPASASGQAPVRRLEQ